ncbi:hypothetical protein ES702_02978 [subsurface metagenome]
MKIVTINVPESYIDFINKLIGFNGLYPSRSELIRCAVREFLIKELKMAKSEALNKLAILTSNHNDNNSYVHVPISINAQNEPIKAFKTYKILNKLETKSEQTEPQKLSYFCRICDKKLPSRHFHFINKALNIHEVFCSKECKLKYINSVREKNND